MEDKNVPYIVYEGTMARFERTIKRLIIALVIAVLLIFASNGLWLYEWCQYDYSNISVDSEDGGNANYLQAGMDGVINNAENSGQKESQEK